jgi:hypothetical protein
MQRRSNVKVAAGALALGISAAAIGVAVISHGSAPVAAQPASYNQSSMNEWGLLNAAVSGWGSARGTSLSDLADVKQMTYSQAKQQGKTLDLQRGIVVFASQQFLILQSKGGNLRLWTLSGHTQFQNEATSTTGSTALTASGTAAEQVVSGQMVPAIDMMTGNTSTAARLLTPTSQPQSVTVQVKGTDLTVTITITRNTATMSQTATMPANGSPVYDPTTMTMSAWSTAGTATSLARGDLAMVVGTRSHGLLRALIVLYAPVTAGDVRGTTRPHPTATPTAIATHW